MTGMSWAIRQEEQTGKMKDKTERSEKQHPASNSRDLSKINFEGFKQTGCL